MLLRAFDLTAVDTEPRVDAGGITLATAGPLRCRASARTAPGRTDKGA